MDGAKVTRQYIEERILKRHEGASIQTAMYYLCNCSCDIQDNECLCKHFHHLSGMQSTDKCRYVLDSGEFAVLYDMVGAMGFMKLVMFTGSRQVR